MGVRPLQAPLCNGRLGAERGEDNPPARRLGRHQDPIGPSQHLLRVLVACAGITASVQCMSNMYEAWTCMISPETRSSMTWERS